MSREADKLKKHEGKLTTFLVVIVALVLIAGAGWFALCAVRDRSIAKGNELLSSGTYTEAHEYFKRAEKYSLRPDARALEGLAKSALALEDYEEAAESYTKLTKLEPENANAHYMLGRLYVRAKNYDGANKEIKALRGIATEDAMDKAEKLSGKIQTGMVKGIFRGLFEKVLPNLPKIPGITEDAPVSSDEGSGDGQP